MNIPPEILGAMLSATLLLLGWEIRQVARLRESCIEILMRLGYIEKELGLKPPAKPTL